MKRLGIILGILLLPVLLHASNTINFETISVTSTTASAFTTASTYASHADQYGTPRDYATIAHVTVEDADVRIRLDGTAATAAVGTLVYAGNEITITGQKDIARFSVIGNAGESTAKLQVHYIIE